MSAASGPSSSAGNIRLKTASNVAASCGLREIRSGGDSFMLGVQGRRQIPGRSHPHGAAQTRREQLSGSWLRPRRAEVFALPLYASLACLQSEPEPFRFEELCFHHLQIWTDSQSRICLLQNVAFQIDTGRNFNDG